jgi:MYXO-CTERM domain-containing protein
LIFAGFAGGCTPSLDSDNDVVNVKFVGAHDIDDRQVVTGTTLVPSLVNDVATGLDVTDCYAISGDPGAWAESGGRFTSLAAGAAPLTLAAQACTVNGGSFTATDDTLALAAIDPADATAGVRWLEDVAQDPSVHLVDPVPDGLVPGTDEPIRVVSGGTLAITPEWRAADGTLVGWSDAALGTSAEGSGMDAEIYRADVDSTGVIRVDVASGADAIVHALLDGSGDWPVAHVVGDDGGPYTLDSVVVAVVVGDDGTSAPLGARAVVRNAAGELVFGADVVWSSDVLQTTSGVETGLPSADYVTLADACRDPSSLEGEQHATLTATLDGQAVSADVVWTPAPGDGTEWVMPASCETGDSEDTGDTKTPGCGCATGDLAGSTGAIGLLAVAALVRRRGRRGTIPT